MAGPIKLFFSYSHKDEDLRDELEAHLSLLERQGVIESWHDRRVAPGQERAGEIDRSLEAAGIILLLVSPDFVASDYCYAREMTRALERNAAGQATVIPVILRPTDWHGAPFGGLQALPRDGRPVTLWPERDEAWLDVVRGIRMVTERMGAVGIPQVTSPPAPPSSSPPLQQGQGMKPRDPTTSSLRKLINEALPGDPDLTAFCTNHYRSVLNRFTIGMDRVTKVNLLLQYTNNGDLLQKLREEHEDHPEVIEEMIGRLIRY